MARSATARPTTCCAISTARATNLAAREASAIYRTTLGYPRFNLKESPSRTQDFFTIAISDPDLCGRYCGRYIAGVRIGPSPDWLKRRLEAVGVLAHGNIFVAYPDELNWRKFHQGHRT